MPTITPQAITPPIPGFGFAEALDADATEVVLIGLVGVAGGCIALADLASAIDLAIDRSNWPIP